MTTALRPGTPAQDLARVLVVDDQSDIRKALQLLLKTHGYESHSAASPAAALAAVESERYDLLIMDLNYTRDTTSGGEGLELLRRVRAADPALPIVAMTAWSTVPLAVAALRGGVGDFVEKPWDNARLLEVMEIQVEAGRARRHARRLEHDAREVQSRILGSVVPQVRGYGIGAAWRFVEGLGGDAYEVVPLSGGRLAVAIADVCGKGLPAALLMASVHATLQDAAAADLPPRDACRHLAAQMSPRLGPERFVSLVYAVLDPAAGRLVYVNAGHPPGVLLRRDRQARRLATGGPVIGLGRDIDFEAGVFPLFAGDRLVLYTDGITEAVGAAGEEFGDGRLVAHFQQNPSGPAPEAAAGLIEEAAAFAGGALADDATAVVVTVGEGESVA